MSIMQQIGCFPIEGYETMYEIYHESFRYLSSSIYYINQWSSLFRYERLN